MPRGVTTLSRQRIVEAAVELADATGIEGLTMRELAAHLGVGTMSIYHHLPDKRALHEALADYLWSKLSVPDRATPWEDRMRDLTAQLWRAARRHPALVPVLLTRRFTGPDGLPAVDALLGAACDAGFDAAGSVRCFRVLTGFAIGLAQAEATRTRADHERPPRRALVDGEPAARFPYLHGALASGALDRPVDDFAFGMEAILTGFRAAVADLQ